MCLGAEVSPIVPIYIRTMGTQQSRTEGWRDRALQGTTFAQHRAIRARQWAVRPRGSGRGSSGQGERHGHVAARDRVPWPRARTRLLCSPRARQRRRGGTGGVRPTEERWRTCPGVGERICTRIDRQHVCCAIFGNMACQQSILLITNIMPKLYIYIYQVTEKDFYDQLYLESVCGSPLFIKLTTKEYSVHTTCITRSKSAKYDAVYTAQTHGWP